MKFALLIVLLITSLFSYSQEKFSPLPASEIEHIAKGISGVEITFYESSQSVSMEGNTNCLFLPASCDTIVPDSLNNKKHAYIMIMVNDDFYMDAELSWSDTNPYLILKKDGIKYHSKLTEQGAFMFKQLLGKK